MPARHTTLMVEPREMLEITDGDVLGGITFMVVDNDAWIGATSGEVPSDETGFLLYKAGDGRVNVTLAELFPGIDNPTRLFSFGSYRRTRVTVSHA